MGTSKLMGERLMTAANSNKRGDGAVFASTRFGNVLGSNGSVIPIFHNQIAEGGPVTLTDKLLKILHEKGVDNINVINGETRVGDVKRNYSDTSKAKTKLGWVPVMNQDEGLQNTVEYFLK